MCVCMHACVCVCVCACVCVCVCVCVKYLHERIQITHVDHSVVNTHTLCFVYNPLTAITAIWWFCLITYSGINRTIS